ncbi:dTDP-4-dehydrorhamnose 3,5-epimerase [Sporolactobacillus shoreicorticis]|uniref:dTDP-4-dehydrorhamnose 3,5-epimerase n=1 Tax=Sporolactobacillus shoreicorticis TaxID=1923877 RepID=A0ABW5S2V6_9BACL|nr:dTDP-4-dehydrorhamnose 3,5-epimerase [Sporolactobacillus shoreicorticis]MCO7124186.1 dTDP-4-dehydrorhamnose 3,5-epimerase [Sporolactobacillus shoreicorticis]
MKVTDTFLKGVKIIEPKAFGDNRGYFMESYNAEKLAEHDIHTKFIQDNQSLSSEAGIVRGLHYQLSPKCQTKLLRVLTGAILDVVVDIRKGSPTFGKWGGFILSEYNKRQLLIPKGFAHGFCTLTPNVNVFYKVDEFYAPEQDRGILWNDPAIGIDWPVTDPILSEKDTKHPLLKDAEINFEFGAENE